MLYESPPEAVLDDALMMSCNAVSSARHARPESANLEREQPSSSGGR